MTPLQQRILLYTGIYCSGVFVIPTFWACNTLTSGLEVACIMTTIIGGPFVAPLLIPRRFRRLFRIVRWICALLLLLSIQFFLHTVRKNSKELLSGTGGYVGPLLVAIVGILAVLASMLVLLWPDVRRIAFTIRSLVNSSINGTNSEMAMKHVTACLWASILMSSLAAAFLTYGFCMLLYSFFDGPWGVQFKSPYNPVVVQLLAIGLWFSGPLLFWYSFLQERSILKRLSGKLAFGMTIWFICIHLAFLSLLGVALL